MKSHLGEPFFCEEMVKEWSKERKEHIEDIANRSDAFFCSLVDKYADKCKTTTCEWGVVDIEPDGDIDDGFEIVKTFDGLEMIVQKSVDIVEEPVVADERIVLPTDDYMMNRVDEALRKLKEVEVNR